MLARLYLEITINKNVSLRRSSLKNFEKKEQQNNAVPVSPSLKHSQQRFICYLCIVCYLFIICTAVLLI